jgi:hypothetical protein
MKSLQKILLLLQLQSLACMSHLLMLQIVEQSALLQIYQYKTIEAKYIVVPVVEQV